jgi:hypothetical protein
VSKIPWDVSFGEPPDACETYYPDKLPKVCPALLWTRCEIEWVLQQAGRIVSISGNSVKLRQGVLPTEAEAAGWREPYV